MSKIKIPYQKAVQTPDGIRDLPAGLSTNPKDLHGGDTKFTCDRKIAGRNDMVVFQVTACSGSEAAQVADELAYAVAWNRGTYPDEQHKKAPEPWALAETKSL